MPPSGWIGVDLDGTFAKWDGTCNTIGDPIPLMLARVVLWLEKGIEVRIFTARASVPEMIPPIREWLKKHGLPDLKITCCKDFAMVRLYDDMCTQVERNTGRLIGEDVDPYSDYEPYESIKKRDSINKGTLK